MSYKDTAGLNQENQEDIEAFLRERVGEEEPLPPVGEESIPGGKPTQKKGKSYQKKQASEGRHYRASQKRRSTDMKQGNNAVVTGVLFFASLIVLIYTLLEFRSQLLTVLGASACFLIMAGIVISQISIAVRAYQKKQNLLLESRLTELQNRLVAITEDSQESARSSAFYARKLGEALAGFEDELLDNQRKENVLLQRVIATQTKAAKVLVKYNDINTNRLVKCTSKQYQQMEQVLDSSINNTNVELRKIGENIMMIQRTPVQPSQIVMPQVVSVPAAEESLTPVEPKSQAPVAEQTLEQAEPESPTQAAEQQATPEEAESKEAAAPVAEMPADPNAKLSPDQIAALFASATEPESPTQQATPEEAESKEAAAPTAEMPADPNAKLSPDQIAALFASATEPESPTQQATPEEAGSMEAAAPVAEMPADPNAKLSPDQIAALFASANG